VKSGPIRAVVQNIVTSGRHGPYAVTRTERNDRFVTFALKKPVWDEEHFPEPGTVVLLEGVYERRLGFRAQRATLSRLPEE